MTELEANNYLKDYQTEIFAKNINGTPSYAAVVLHPEIPFEYAIEIGYKNSTITSLIDRLKYLLVNENTNQIIIDEIKSISKEEKQFNTEKGDFNDKEYYNDFDSKIINELGQMTLKSIGFSEKISIEIINKNIYIKEAGEVNKLCKNNNNPSVYAQKYLEGGIGISHYKSFEFGGTLGGIFKMHNSNDNYAITNAHVFHKGDCNDNNSAIVHPAKGDVGEEKIIGNIFWMIDEGKLDAGIIRLNTNMEVKKFTRCGKIELKTPIKASIGMTVKKCGKTTEYSEGEIKSVNATIAFMDGLRGKQVFYTNQIMTTCMADSGDSGSLLVSKSNHVVGLIFAKTTNNTATFANHFHEIFNPSLNLKKCQPKISFKKFINFKDNNND
ncbi:trypsin-like serine protease [Tenacibaculum agarivorans]|uniref:trypsin-like serine protease n=1 Tax=Tenacibaculum agarivorans TaxID=1908389 RepID=UPI00094B9851|nr:trypsin-like serine protease [Tenacibaculum agarivorans]